MLDNSRDIPIIINRDAGALRANSLTDLGGRKAWVTERRHLPNVKYLKARHVKAAIEAVVQEGHRRIVVGGGDGTLNTAAAICAAANVTLMCLPLGTLNHFARDIGISLEAQHWDETICSPHTKRVDVGFLGERLFLNNFSVGFYPDLAKLRSEIEDERLLGSKQLATAWTVIKMFWQRRRGLKIVFNLNDAALPRDRECTAIIVANNAYDLSIDNLTGRNSLQGGQLVTYFVGESVSVDDLVQVLVSTEETWSGNGIEVEASTEIYLGLERKSVRVAIDGELVRYRTPLVARSEPAALQVVVPPP